MMNTSTPHRGMTAQAPAAWRLAIPETPPVDADTLRTGSARLLDLLAGPDPASDECAQLWLPGVVPGDVLCLGPDPVSGSPVASDGVGDGIILAGNELTIDRFGYLGLVGDRFSVLSPLKLSEDAMTVWLLQLSERSLTLKPEWLLPWLECLGLKPALVGQIANQQLSAVGGKHGGGLLPIILGTPATAAVAPQLESLIDLPVEAATTDATCPVTAGDRLARMRHAVQGQTGRDLFGQVIQPSPVEEEPSFELCAGRHVHMDQSEGETTFVAEADGLAELVNGLLSVRELLSIEGDVSYATGNLHFDGHVEIDGSVAAGHRVEAEGRLVIGADVTSGSHVQARGNVRIGGIVEGPRATVASEGDIRCQSVIRASLVAGGGIRVERDAHHAQLFAGSSVTIERNGHPNSGCLIGGKVHAGRQIIVEEVGDASRSETTVIVGIDPASLEEHERVCHQMAVAYQQVMRLLKQFQVKQIDVAHIRNLIAAAEGPRRRVLARRAHQLGHLAQVYQDRLRRHEELERQIEGASADTEICVRGHAHPGVTVQVGTHRRVLEHTLGPTTFRVEAGQLVGN